MKRLASSLIDHLCMPLGWRSVGVGAGPGSRQGVPGHQLGRLRRPHGLGLAGPVDGVRHFDCLDREGEVFHISLPAGFNITGISISVGPVPLGRLTTTLFQDMDQDDLRDPGEPTLGSTTLTSSCHPDPTRAQQCSNGGWRTFGLFSSQGDCVAFVTTRGANEPGQNVPGPPDRNPDSVTGSGSSSFCGGAFEVNGPKRTERRESDRPGHLWEFGFSFAGPVTCLNVTGNVALLNIESGSFGPVALRITDLGTTGDVVEANIGSGCDLPQAGYIDVGFSGGDITITG